MPKSIWELEAEVRRILQSGVDFGEGRILAVSGLDGDVLKWVKLEGNSHRRFTAVYVKDAARVTVYARIHDDGAVEITMVSLDKMCGGGGAHV
jgi:hypothetical protein